MTSLAEILNGYAALRESGYSPGILAQTKVPVPDIQDTAVLESVRDVGSILQVAIADFLAHGHSPDDIAKMVAKAQQSTDPLPGQRILPGFEPFVFDPAAPWND